MSGRREDAGRLIPCILRPPAPPVEACSLAFTPLFKKPGKGTHPGEKAGVLPARPRLV